MTLTGRSGYVCASAELAHRIARSRLFRKQLHRTLEAIERGGIHASVHQLLDHADRLAVAPDLLGLGVEPHALRIDVHEALDPHPAGLFVEVLDRAARL